MNKKKIVVRSYRVVMNYKNTCEELIEGGNLDMGYGGEEGLINSKNFPPIVGKDNVRFLQEKDIYVINFSKAMETDEVITELKKLEYQPADIFELLTLNRTYPASIGIKKCFSLNGTHIIALGSLLEFPENKNLYLAPILSCEEGEDNMKRRTIHLNLTEYFDEFEKKVKKFNDWWPEKSCFAATNDY
ncbi:MAG: hypothetical protein AAB698_00740 [Patescibacteria group bacterium]